MPGMDVVTLPSLIGAPVAFWPLFSPQPSPAVAALSPTRPASDAVVSDGAVVSPVLAAVVPAAVVAAAAVVAVAAAVVAVAAVPGAAVPLELLSSLPHATR